MKTNIPLISTLRKPINSLLLLILIGLISFGFITKAIGFILIQRETGVLGSYYRSIGTLENTKDPQSFDVSKGIDLIANSPYYAYGDQREIVSAVMPQTYNSNVRYPQANYPYLITALPKEYWPNTHNADQWFSGELITKEEVKDDKRKKPENKITIGYYLKFTIDNVLAAYPEDAEPGSSIGVLFLFAGNEAAIPLIEEMETGQRYLIRSWKIPYTHLDLSWENTHEANYQLLSLDDGQLWYMPLGEGASIDFNDPGMPSIKNKIDILNENLHTLSIITTADMSAMPQMQETSRDYYLTQGRWLNHQDDLDRNKVIVVPSEFAEMRDLKLGDEIQLTFRPLKDAFVGYIRDGVDSLNWRSYRTYQDVFRIVGIIDRTRCCVYFAYIPSSSLQPGFTSATQNQFQFETGYSFVLDSSRNETQFLQTYKAPLQALGINMTFLPNNGSAYWAAVDPIRRSSSADILVYSMLLVLALILVVFLYMMTHRREFAILRALGVPAKKASVQLALPLLLLGGLGILGGGLASWNYGLHQAEATLSTLPTPAGATPSAHLSPFILAGLWGIVFLFLSAFSWLGVFTLSRRPVYELLQGQSFRTASSQKKQSTDVGARYLACASRIVPRHTDQTGMARNPASAGMLASTSRVVPLRGDQVEHTTHRKYTPSSLSWYVIHHGLRSRLKSLLTLAVALGFILAIAWIRLTMERSRIETDRLYDTTVVQADIIQANPTVLSTIDVPTKGSGFVYQKTIESVLNSGFVISSSLEADITWMEIGNFETPETIVGRFPVYAYDTPEAFYSGLADPNSLSFATGWNMEHFAQPRTIEEIRQEGVPALFPASLLGALQLRVGDRVRIIDSYANIFPCIIVGQYSGGRSLAIHGSKIPWVYSPVDSILISLPSLHSLEGSQVKYTVAHFTLDPSKNRELPQLRTEMEKVIQSSGAGTGDLRFRIWDEELKVVTSQLDKNMSLLRVLYPVVMAVSILIGAGLCFLLLLQATKEAAIMRVLGTTRAAVRLALIAEPLILSVIGVLIGTGISLLLLAGLGSIPVVPLLLGAGLYLAGALVGLVIGAISVTNKKPIELLQVKE
jgi:hypothetical protein